MTLVHYFYHIRTKIDLQQRKSSNQKYSLFHLSPAHPLGVAHIIADLKLDTPSILTALLHDTVEDTPVTLQNITNEFSSEISRLGEVS